MASDGDFLYYAIIGFGVGIFLFIKGFTWLKLKKLIENTPTSKIRSIAMGLVEIYGRVLVTNDKMLKSPFSNKDCGYYKYTIEEYKRSGKRSKWHIVKFGEKSTHFYLLDNTGQVLIEPKGANISIEADNEYNSDSMNNPPKQVIDFLKREKIDYEGFLGFNKKMRYREYFIAPKDMLYILGTAGDNPFVEEGSSRHSLDDIMIQKGKNNKIYYISDKPEREVLNILRWKVIGGIIGGGILSIISLSIIFFYFGIL